MMTEPDDLAFPYCEVFDSGQPRDHTGLTKREYFAALAMQGIASLPTTDWSMPYADKASEAVLFADALIAALNKEQPCKQ